MEGVAYPTTYHTTSQEQVQRTQSTAEHPPVAFTEGNLLYLFKLNDPN